MLKIELLITYLFLVLTTGIYGQMYISGRFIYTSEGEKVVLRGVNEMLVWSSDPNGSWVMAEIAKTGANVVRISCQDDYSADKLEKAVQNANFNGMIVMPSIWHATGKWDQLQRCVDYWLRDDVKTALQNNESHLLLNIANEAGNHSITDAQFVSEYKKAVTQLRDAGYQCPLVIDGTDWGKNYNILLKNWDELNKHDPLENIIVSAHTYWNGSESQRKSYYDEAIRESIEKGIPFIFGEGPTPSAWDCTNSPYGYGIEQCYKNEIGWLGWSWGLVNNGDCTGKYDWTTNGHFGSWETKAGSDMAVDHLFSIYNTSKRPMSLGGDSIIPVKGVVIHNKPDTLRLGQSFNLEGYALPLVANNRSVEWLPGNIEIVVVDSLGTLTAKGVGSTTVKVVTSEGNFSDSCSVVVVDTISRAWENGALKVSKNGRFLVHSNGTPFWWMGDTAWELFYRLKSSDEKGNDIEKYFLNRKERGFSVVQSVLLDELEYKNNTGCAQNGSMPFVNRDPNQPVEAYWEWVDYVLNRAEHYGLYVCVLPCWGNWVNNEAIFNTKIAYDYGKFLGERYKNQPNIIWMLGGDRGVTDYQKTIWASMAKGIKDADTLHVMTFHPQGAKSSSSSFHNETWLDFNTYQSGHAIDEYNAFNLALTDWAKKPVKPTLNGEPGYEGIPEKFWESSSNTRMTDYDCRKDAFRSLFAGTFGHTYGHSSIWQMLREGDNPVAGANPSIKWHDAIEAPGSLQMGYVGKLMKSRSPYRQPDAQLLVEGLGSGAQHMEATLGFDYAMVYFPVGATKTIALGKTSGTKVACYWYNPRNGENFPIGTFSNSGSREFSTPDELDWVLVIDDVNAKYPTPGTVDIWKK